MTNRENKKCYNWGRGRVFADLSVSPKPRKYKESFQEKSWSGSFFICNTLSGKLATCIPNPILATSYVNAPPLVDVTLNPLAVADLVA